nr:MAG TPA: hypothetical protein [Caudoviricetes sp.]
MEKEGFMLNKNTVVETTTEWLAEQKAKETPSERMARFMKEEELLRDAGYYDDDDELY